MSQERTPHLKRAVPVLTAIDVAANATFWVETLGFTGGLVAEGFAIIRRDDIELFITAVEDQLIPDNTQAWIRVSDLDLLHAQWSAKLTRHFTDASGPALTPVESQPWGREFALRDPAGNCIHFSEVPR